MKIVDLKRDSTVQQWLSIVNIRSETTKGYLLGLQNYTEFTGKTPEQLLEEADKEQDENIKVRNRAVNKQLFGFRNHLQERGLAPLSIKGYINGVKSFYRAFDIEFKPIRQEGVAVLKENKKIPTVEDIRDILKVCDPLEKAIVLTGCSGGLDSNTISNLKVLDFKNGFDPDSGITTLILRRLKTNIDFVTFLTPEASEAILDYLKYRARTVETSEVKRLNQLAKQKVNADSNYLFILRKISDEYLKEYDEELRRIDRAAFMKIYRDISTKANKNTKKGQFNFIRSHNFRKFFDSMLINNGCDYLHIEEFMGHSLPGTQGHYFTPNIEELKKYYANFIPFLTINRPIDLLSTKEWQSLQDENMRLRSLAKQYVIDGLKLIQAEQEVRRLKREKMTPEEREENKEKSKKELIEWVENMVPKDDNETEFKEKMKKALGFVE